MSQPTVTAVAQRQYDLLPAGWRAHDNDEDGWLLLGLIEATCSPLAELWELAEDPGPRAFFNVDTVSAKWLPRLAERNGARLTGGMTEAEQRAEIKNPTGWRRTLPDSIVEAATNFLPPGAWFLYRERTNPDVPGDQPAHMALSLRWDDVDPSEYDDILAAFIARIPIGMFGHLLMLHITWGEEAAEHATWGDLSDAHATWGDVSGGAH
jgi:hypothetical protein